MTVVVTGVGAVTALGGTARTTFERVLAGDRGLHPLTLFDPGDARARIVAEVHGLETHGLSRTGALALTAAREAVADAGLDLRSRRVGLVLAGTTAGLFDTELHLPSLRSGRDVEAALARMPDHPLTGPTAAVTRALGPFARVRTLSSACSGGANALAVGATWLELGLVDAVLCGGADALCRVTFAGFNALGAIDPEGARPFDIRRRGLTLGEGAGLVVLERAGDAGRARCSLLGWASRSEAHHITNPAASGDAPFAAITAALGRAGLSASDVDYVNAHGTGTPLNDPMEARVIVRLLGDRAARVPVSSQKGMIGHTLAAAGAIEAVLTALAIEKGIVPPTGGLETPDPDCPLRHVLASEAADLRIAVSSSFGFGGMDAALVLGRSDHSAPLRTRSSVRVTAVSVVTPAGTRTGRDVADLATRHPGPMDVPALDADRARRLDATSRMAAAACAALGPTREAGIVLGNAFGAIELTTALVERLAEKGPRLVRPADFPGLVPSSPGGHVSIYLGLTGPALVVADEALSGEAAIVQAWELVASGDAAALCAGAVEEASPMVEAQLRGIFGEGRYANAPRREGAGFVILAAEGEALAVLDDVFVWVGEAPQLPAPVPGAIVVSAVDEPFLDRTAWRDVPRITCGDACGMHEAGGALAFAVAVAKVAASEATRALFVGTAGARGYAIVVSPAPSSGTSPR